jgi:hypothetical protein
VSRFRKILYPIVITLLAWLAVLPYWPTLRDEAAHIYTAWQQVRGTGETSPGNENGPVTGTEGDNRRERAIAPPKPAGALPAPKAGDSPAKAVDPFIREARERANKDPEAAMQWLQAQSTGSERLRGMLEVVALWAAEDSESAMLWLESNAQGLARLETLNSGVELWARRDPQAAAGWVDGMANDQSKIAAAKSLATTWGQSNPTAATEWLDRLPSGPVREEAAGALALSWMETDAAGAADWARQEAVENGNTAMLNQVIEKYARLAPNEAESFARKLDSQLTQLQSSSLSETRYFEAFVQTRAERNPAETAEWLENFDKSDPFYSPDHAKQLMTAWTATDSIAASAWLSEQAISPERDAAIVGFAESIRRFEPEAAATWANTISDAEIRMQELTKSVQSWAQTKPDAALQWVIDAELEPALQEQLAREIGFE